MGHQLAKRPARTSRTTRVEVLPATGADQGDQVIELARQRLNLITMHVQPSRVRPRRAERATRSRWDSAATSPRLCARIHQHAGVATDALVVAVRTSN